MFLYSCDDPYVMGVEKLVSLSADRFLYAELKFHDKVNGIIMLTGLLWEERVSFCICTAPVKAGSIELH